MDFLTYLPTTKSSVELRLGNLEGVAYLRSTSINSSPGASSYTILKHVPLRFKHFPTSFILLTEEVCVLLMSVGCV